MPNERKIKAQMAQCRGSLTKAENFWQEQQNGPFDKEAVLSRLRQIDNVLTKYNDLSLELQLLNEEDSADEFKDTFVDDGFEDRALAISSKLRSLLNTHQQAQECVNGNRCSASIALPQMDIPVYDGKDYTQYQTFIELFSAMIHNNVKLESIQKLFYLRKFLKGEPLSLIEGLPIIGESYEKALELLKNRYDNKFLIITNHVQTLLDIQPIVRNSASNLRELISQSRQHLGALKTLGQATDSWDMVILPILLRKIDQFSCRAYHSERDNTKLPTLEDFFTFMERRASSFEESQKSEGVTGGNDHRRRRSPGLFDSFGDTVSKPFKQLSQSVGQIASTAKERVPFSDGSFDKVFTSSDDIVKSFRKQQTNSLSLLPHLLPEGLNLPQGLPILGLPTPPSTGPAPPRPAFDRSLQLHVDLIVPLSGFTETYEIEWHKESDTMRKVLESGTTVYRSPQGDGKVVFLEVSVEPSGISKVYHCYRSTVSLAAPATKAFPGLPDISDYEFAGNSSMELWRKVIKNKPGEGGAVKGETLTVTHEMLVAKEKGETVPVRYTVTTDSSILGPGSDVYVQNYKVLPTPTAAIKPDTSKCGVIEDIEKPRQKRAGFLSKITDTALKFNPAQDFSLPFGDFDIGQKFDSFKNEFKRSYLDPAEEAVRRNLLSQSTRFIEAGNSKGNSFTMGVNFLADRLEEEIQQLFGIKEPEGLTEPGMVEFPYSDKDVKAMSDKLPKEFDWRTLGAVSPVRYQGTTCASCWAFAVAGSTEGALFKETNKLVPLSPQCLVDCGKQYGTQGCGPTWPSFAYDYIQNRGLSAWDEYTDYEAKVLECKDTSVPSVTHISGHVNVTANSEEALKLAIKNHAPTVVLVDAMAKSFIYYKNGVLNDKNCGQNKPRLNHAVLAVGWGSKDGSHFILKNSWSDKWGDEGYIRVAPDSCAVLERPTYSLVQPPNIDRQALRAAVKD